MSLVAFLTFPILIFLLTDLQYFQALHPDPVDSDEDLAGEEDDLEEPGMFDDAEEEGTGEDNGTEQMDAD